MKKILISFFLSLLFSITGLAQGLLPPGFTNNGTGGGYTNNLPPYVFPTNGLWLWITNVANGTVYANLNGATDYVYAVLSSTNLNSSWSIETEVFPGLSTNSMPFAVSEEGRSSVYLTAMDWTGITSNGNQTPLWWLFYWFGPAGLELSDTNLDSSGQNDLLYDYQNVQDPNTISFYIGVTNIYVNSPNVPAQLTVSGMPSYIGVAVDDPNFQTDVNWQPYSFSNIMANLGTNEGWHNVWVGLRGYADAATNGVWQMQQMYLDLTPPMLVITNPTTTTVSTPMVQIQGYSSKDLANISYNLYNAGGFWTNLPVQILSRYPNANNSGFTTNYFQAFDVPLIQGTNILTFSASDDAGNIETTNFDFVLDYSSITNPAAVNLYWPQNGAMIGNTNYTWRGWISDPTATVAAQMVDTNGDTNTFSAVVERDGNFWVENIPVASGTNYLTLYVTNVVGLVTITNIAVTPGGVSLTIDTPSSGELSEQGIAVTGTISNTNDYTVWVNGVKATLNGDGTWTATNVDLPTTGTAVIQARAIPNSDNGGNGTGGGGGGSVTYGNTGNPTSTQENDAELQVDKPMTYYITSYTESDTNSNYGTNVIYDNEGNELTYGGFDYCTYDSTNWIDQSGGFSVDNYFGKNYGRFSVPPEVATNLETFTWPPSGDGTVIEIANSIPSGFSITTNELPTPLFENEHCNLNGQLNTTRSLFNDNGVLGNWAISDTSFSRQAQTTMQMNAGGKGVPGEQNLFTINATAESGFLTIGPWWNDNTAGVNYSLTTPVNPTQIAATGQNFDTNGNLSVVLPDNGTVDITPEVPGGSYYSFTVNANQYTPGPITVSVESVQDAQEPGFIPDSSDCSVPNYTVFGQTGYFQITRTGDTTGPLNVYYSLGGTAEQGQEYVSGPGIPYLGGHIVLPAGWPRVSFAPGQTNAFVPIYPEFDPANYGTKTVILTLYPGSFSIGQTNATMNVVDSDVDYLNVGLGFPSGIPVPTNGIVNINATIQREDGVSDIGYGPFPSGFVIVSEAKLGTDYTFGSTNCTVAPFTNAMGESFTEFQVVNSLGKVEPLYVYTVLAGACIGYHQTGQPGDTLESQAAGSFTLTVLSHGTQPQTLKTFWVNYQLPFIWLFMWPHPVNESQLGTPSFSILN